MRRVLFAAVLAVVVVLAAELLSFVALRFLHGRWLGWSDLARAAFAEFLAPGAGEVERNVLMHFLGVAGDGPAYLSHLTESGEIDVREQAATLRMPVLVTASDIDTTVPMAASRELASLIPGSRFELLPDASHIGASAQDPRMMELASEFLRSKPTTAPGGR